VSELKTVCIRTTLGDYYEFPSVGAEALSTIPPSGQIPLHQPNLSLVNVSFSFVSVLFNIIERVWVKDTEEVLWQRLG